MGNCVHRLDRWEEKQDELLSGIKRLEDANASAHPGDAPAPRNRISLLEMQIGFFRLLQGAAYRVKSEAFAFHTETDKKVLDMPYVLSDFVQFLGDAVEWYKCLELVDVECHPLLDSLVASARQMRERLAADIKSFDPSKDMPAGQRVAHQAHEKKVKENEQKTAKLCGALLKQSKLKILVRAHKTELMDYHHEESHNDRDAEINAYYANMKPGEAASRDELIYWKDSTWFYVIEDRSAPLPPAGSMVPVKYWYDDFMPKLLMAFSVSTNEDVAELEMSEAARASADDAWFKQQRDAHAFDHYGQDILASWEFLEPQQKRSVRQAWRLLEPYFFGAQKMRERFEGSAQHRYTGSLSDYVVFIDVYLGRTNGRDAASRCTFPYYLGPPTWLQFHCSAEIVSLQTQKAQARSIGVFKKFFLGFMDLYPCPFCRHHFNAFVKLGKETQLYPLEYLLFGWTPPSKERMAEVAEAGEDFASLLVVTAEERVEAVTDGDSLRSLLWKLHNSVNGSIARGEEWYKTKKAHRIAYTNRYYPAVDLEIARCESHGRNTISTKLVTDIHKLEVIGAHLSRLREDLMRSAHSTPEAFLEAVGQIVDVIEKLDKSLQKSRLIQEAYTFDRKAIHEPLSPISMTASQERFARSGTYIEH